MSKQENKTVLNCTIGGTLMYPKKEGNTVKYAIAIDELTKGKLEQAVRGKFGARTLTIKEDEHNKGKYLLNVKTSFELPVYDKEKNLLEDVKLYHGAEVYASVSVKEYQYMGKTGITTYLTGIVLLQNGEPTGVSADNILNNIL